MVTGTITTAPDAESDTILFHSVDTPSGAYSKLTDAVINARHYDSYIQIDIEDIPPHTVIGTATYEDEKVASLSIKQNILNEYGVTDDSDSS